MSGNNNKERSSDESSNNVIKHFADASFLFAFNDDDENEETNYEEIRALSKRMKALGCTKVTESFSLKTNDATHIVCRSEEEYNSRGKSRRTTQFVFELFHDEDDENEHHLSSARLMHKASRKGLGRAFEHLVPTTEDVGKDTEGLKICQTSYTGPRRNDVNSLIERLGRSTGRSIRRHALVLLSV